MPEVETTARLSNDEDLNFAEFALKVTTLELDVTREPVWFEEPK